MRPDRARLLDLTVAAVTPKTHWIFVEIETEAGLRGAGEASLAGHEQAVAEAVERLAPMLFGLPDADVARLSSPLLADLPAAAAFSALDQALWDVTAQRRGLRLADALGGVRRGAVPVYANINRRTLDRTPRGFADSARAAIVAGHDAVKIAPFDEATPAARSASALDAAIEPGLRRVAAVRDAIGPGRRLMVDCHWRLDEAAAGRVIDAAAGLDVHWVECPLPETAAHIAALRRLRRAANQHGVLLAGLETAVGLTGFRPFLDAAAYDVMMPDVKYVGGLAKVLRLAEAMRCAGVAFSPHNPTGPVCHAVSLQVCATVDAPHSLETQFGETPRFAALASAELQTVTAGVTPVPSRAGIGMALQPEPLAACRTFHRTFARSDHA